MRVLVSNDDGVDAPGIRVLAECLGAVGQVTVVAPDRDRSGASNSLTLDAPLRVLLAATHPLARKKKIALADLMTQRLLVIGGAEVSSHAELLQRIFAGRGLKMPAPRAVNGYEAFLAMVASGQGISLLQKTPSLGAIESLTTRPLQESGPDLFLQARALWPDGDTSPLLGNFVAVLRAVRPGRN